MSKEKAFSTVRRDRLVETCLLCTLWTVLAVALAYWFSVAHQQNVREQALTAARISIAKDLAYRRWAAVHGGVYVPASELTPPNPYLLDLVPERDIVTPAGRELTLVNPAYMTRQVYELQKESEGLDAHLTSLNPLRPENSPDDWEREALLAFNQGRIEVWSTQHGDSDGVLRLMKPFLVEKNCLSCHKQQGYREGDIRGGISVTVPLKPFHASLADDLIGNYALVVVLWSTGLVCILLFRHSLRQRLYRHLNEELVALVEKRTAELDVKNQELMQFAQVVAHDLRAPLVSITGFSDILAQSPEIAAESKNRTMLGYIHTSALQMSHFIDRLLQYATIGKTSVLVEAVSLEAVFANVRMSLTAELRQVGATLDIHAGAPLVCGDAQLLYQVFLNLVQNAVKYAREGVAPVINITWQEQNDRVVVSVRDNGLGISAEHFEEIFEPFSRIKVGNQRGTGLGLASVRRALQIMDGDISLESVVGEGSCFRVVLLPACQDARATGCSHHGNQQAHCRHSKETQS